MNRIARLFMILSVFGFHACTDSEDDLYSPEQGIYVVSQASGQPWSVSFYQFSTGEVLDNFFAVSNPGESTAGDQVLDMVKRRNNAYILSKNGASAGNIRVVSYIGFKQSKKIELPFAPSAMVFITDTELAISKAGIAEVAIYNTEKSEVTRTIKSIVNDPGQMLVKGKYLYIASTNTKLVNVVDHSTDKLAAEIPTMEIPENMVLDVTDNLWIYNRGGGLTKVKHLSWQNDLIKENFSFSSPSGSTVFNIGISPTLSYIYYFENGLKRHFIDNSSLPERNFIKKDEPVTSFSSFNIDDKSGNIYYLSNNEEKNLSIFRSDGNQIKSLTVGKGAIKTVPYY